MTKGGLSCSLRVVTLLVGNLLGGCQYVLGLDDDLVVLEESTQEVRPDAAAVDAASPDAAVAPRASDGGLAERDAALSTDAASPGSTPRDAALIDAEQPDAAAPETGDLDAAWPSDPNTPGADAAVERDAAPEHDAGEWHEGCLPGECQADAATANCADTCDGYCEGEACLECRPGFAECVVGESARRVCDEEGRWQSAELCDVACVGGECTACAPFATTCTERGERVACLPSGSWDAPTACAAACLNGECVECQPGAAECTPDGQRRVCDDTGRFGEPEDCDGACLGGACVSCQPLTSACIDGRLAVCAANGAWGAYEVCNGFCLGGACVACEPGAAQCSQNRLSVCRADGTWSAPETCEDQLCDPASGRCVGECTPGDQLCETSQSARTCNASGEFEAAAPCPNGACVNDRCAGCFPTQRVCATGNSYIECDSSGAWPDVSEATSCDEACIDLEPGVIRCGCVPSNTRCDPLAADVPQTCDATGQWLSASPCPFGCGNGVCNECTDDATRCDPQNGNTAQLCVNGHWESQPACEALCRLGECVECDADTYRCLEQQPQKCSVDGVWQPLGPACELPLLQCAVAAKDAACFDNPLRDVGNTDVGTGVPTDLRDNQLFAFPVFVESRAALYGIGLLAPAQLDGDDPEVALALYDSAGDVPGALVAAASATLFLAAGDRVAPLEEVVTIEPGRYWVAYVATSYGRLFSSTDETPDIYFEGHNFGTPWPTSLATATRSAGRRYGVYLQLRRLP